MRPYLLAETTWKTIKDAHFDLAILPWGATEAHNYHLPYATDIFESDYMAAESARIAWEMGAKLIVLPTIPFGVNTGQSDIMLDINMNPSTQMAILNDVVEVLNRQGIKKLMLFNSHGGNDFKPLLRELGLKYPEMFLCISNWFQSFENSTYFENGGDHANEMETSLMLHMRPDLVQPKTEWGEGKYRKNKIDAFGEGWLWTERPWSKVSEDTGIGDPRLATAEKGERLYKDLTQKLGKAMFDISVADVNDLYE